MSSIQREIKYKFISDSDFSKETLAGSKNLTLLALIDNNYNYNSKINAIFSSDMIKSLIEIKNFKAKLGVTQSNVLSLNNDVLELAFIGTGEKSEHQGDDNLKIGGAIAKSVKSFNKGFLFLSKDNICQSSESLAQLIAGIELGFYKFNKYMVDKKDKDTNNAELELVIISESQSDALQIIEEGKKIAVSVALARDLVNEPSNILETVEFAKRIEGLRELGVEVEIFEREKLEELKMGALLAVGKGSKNPPKVAIMRWYGSKNRDEKPVVFVGKGVVFDSGGISIKPAGSMEDMKGDMGGAAAVVGAIHLLASRKSSANVFGIVGLVENMPSCHSMKPGDIVTSMSGQTIEIVNTDAEGRLVLADILHYAKENLDPKIMIDLATLTGAILVALGHEQAGLFSNNENLRNHLLEAAAQTGEKLWSMPLDEAYDKLIDSKFADMRNSAGRMAASSTAAHFLKRFVGHVDWAHLDIAGTAFGMKEKNYCDSWASGYGVRLLDSLVKRNYE